MALNLRPDPITYRQIKNEQIHVFSGMETLRQFAEKLTNKVHGVMENHENKMIRNVTDLNQFRKNTKEIILFFVEVFMYLI